MANLFENLNKEIVTISCNLYTRYKMRPVQTQGDGFAVKNIINSY
jgi:hypothetical protein